MEFSPRYESVHLKNYTTSERGAWKVPSANEKYARSCTVSCSNLEMNSTRWCDDRAQRVGDGLQSKISMCALGNSYDLETSSMKGAISKRKMREIIHRNVLNLELHWRRWWDHIVQGVGESVQSYMMMCAHRCCLLLETSSEKDAISK